MTSPNPLSFMIVLPRFKFSVYRFMDCNFVVCLFVSCFDNDVLLQLRTLIGPFNFFDSSVTDESFVDEKHVWHTKF